MRQLIERARAIAVKTCPGCDRVSCICAKVGTTTKK